MTHRTGDGAGCGRALRVESRGFAFSAFVLGNGYESVEHAHALPGIVLTTSGALCITGRPAVEAGGAGQAILLPAGQAHGEATNAPATCLLLELMPCAVTDAGSLFERCRRIDHPALASAAGRLSGRLAAETDAPWQYEYEAVEIVLLAEDAVVGLEKSERPGWPRWLGRAVERLRDEFRAPPALRDVAADVGVSREHLARQFRRATGLSVGEFVRRRRLQTAMELLRHSKLSLAAVAHASGYVDQSHLTRHLQRRLGVTPNRVRRHAR
jgi:AraC-like DNA-binding protein